MHDLRILIGLGNKIKGPRDRINDWSRDDAHLAPSCGSAVFFYSCGHGSGSRRAVTENAHHPQGRGAGIVSIECVDAVMHGSHIHDIVYALPGNVHSRKIERLSHQKPVDWLRGQFAETRFVYIRRVEPSPGGGSAVSGITVVPGRD